MEGKAPNVAGKSKKKLVVLTVLSILGGVLLKMNFIFFFVGMLPAMVAYIVDHDKNKYIFSTVAALNFAGVFPYMVDIFMQGGTFGAVEAKLSDMVVWLVMYGSAAMGWAVVFASPVIAAAILEGVYAGRILHMESLQAKSVEEWGEEIMEHKE